MNDDRLPATCSQCAEWGATQGARWRPEIHCARRCIRERFGSWCWEMWSLWALCGSGERYTLPDNGGEAVAYSVDAAMFTAAVGDATRAERVEWLGAMRTISNELNKSFSDLDEDLDPLAPVDVD